MVTELTYIPDHYDFYFLEDVSETSYATFRKEVQDKLRTISIDRAKNKEWYRNNNIENYPEKEIQIYIYLSTFGGDCYTGLGLCDFLYWLDHLPGFKVRLICEGKIMSMGIPICVSVRDRVATENTTFMIHELSSFRWGKLEDLKQSVEELEVLQKKIDNWVMKHSKITQEYFDEIYKKKKDIFFDAQEAKRLGIINEIEQI